MIKHCFRFFYFLQCILIPSYIFAQVNLRTGTPQINIPLYTIADASNGLRTAVSLNYDGGNGIKVDDIASTVGTGWDLSFCGSITRITHGEPDDQKQSETYYPLTSPTRYIPFPFAPTDQEKVNGQAYINRYYPNGFLYSEYSASTPVTNGGAFQQLTSTAFLDLPDPVFLADREMDVFSFEFNGRSGTFSIAKTSTLKDAFTYNLKDSKLKIDIVHESTLFATTGIRTTIKKITITDETGIKYCFEDMELTEVIKYTKREDYNNNVLTSTTFYRTYQSASSSNSFKVMRGERTGEFVCNKWMLTSITNPFTNKTITFTYETVPVVIDGPHHVVKSSSSGSNISNTIANIELISYAFKRLKTISNDKNERIECNYSAYREDLAGDRMLDDVSFFKNNILISKFKFSYGYFCKYVIRDITDNFLPGDKAFLRLCLKQVQKVGSNNQSEPPHKFGYIIDDNSSSPKIVPPRFCFFKDPWGYFNAQGTLYGGGISPEWIPEPGKPYSMSAYYDAFSNGFHDINNSNGKLYSSHGLISSIKYPYGGKLEFEYEPNNCLYILLSEIKA